MDLLVSHRWFLFAKLIRVPTKVAMEMLPMLANPTVSRVLLSLASLLIGGGTVTFAISALPFSTDFTVASQHSGLMLFIQQEVIFLFNCSTFLLSSSLTTFKSSPSAGCWESCPPEATWLTACLEAGNEDQVTSF